MAKQKINGTQYSGGDGWIKTSVNPTYVSSDAPTYLVTFAPGTMTDLTIGMKVRLVDNSTVKYFIITMLATDAGSNLVVFLYGGTDSTLSGGTITNFNYSTAASPYGFPKSPLKWTETFSSATTSYTTSPTNDTWYNNNSISKSIPIGLWNLGYQCYTRNRATLALSTPYIDTFTTLSTSPNSETDTQYTTIKTIYCTTFNGQTYDNDCFYNLTNVVSLSVKTTYYLLCKYQSNVTASSLGFAGSQSPTIIKAVCAYL